MRAWFCLLLLAAGCLPDADARTPGRRGIRRVASFGDKSGVPDSGNIFDQPFDYAIEGFDCPGFDGGVQAYPFRGDGGTMAWAFGSDASAHTCNSATNVIGGDAGAPGTGIGEARVGKAFTMAEAGSNCWQATSTTLPALADGQAVWVRMVIAQTNNSANRNIFGFGSSATNFQALQSRSNEAIGLITQTTGLTVYNGLTNVLTLGGQVLVDICYKNGAGGNPQVNACVAGGCNTTAEHTDNLAGFAAGLGAALGANRTCPVASAAAGVSITAIHWHYGTNADYFCTGGETVHDSDWNKLVGL